MPRTAAARVERLEPKAIAAWRLAWDTYAANVRRAIPAAVLEQALRAPTDEAAWEAFTTEHDLGELVAWHDEHDVLPIDPDTPDLAIWPAGLPTPPMEPRHAWLVMNDLRQGTGDTAAYAACAVLILGLARCVHEAQL